MCEWPDASPRGARRVPGAGCIGAVLEAWVLRVSALHYSAGDRIRVGIGQWLQLVRCANLLAVGPSISIINVREFRT